MVVGLIYVVGYESQTICSQGLSSLSVLSWGSYRKKSHWPGSFCTKTMLEIGDVDEDTAVGCGECE